MDLRKLPENLPPPIDDGAAAHLDLKRLPNLSLLATNNETVCISDISGLVVFYVYPMTGRPDTPLPTDWDEIPGARGCTPQSCSFRDHYSQLQKYNASVYGVSVQPFKYQREAKQRLHLPFELLSDVNLELKQALQLPTFEAEGMELYKRITLIVCDGVIVKIFYPVFPPSNNADEVLKWLQSNA